MENETETVFESGSRDAYRKEIGQQMVRGAAVAAAVVFGPILFIYAIYLIGLLLPPESKEADDPTPDSFSQVVIEPAVEMAASSAFDGRGDRAGLFRV
ncbi:MAG: RC-LH1 core complex protein PufX [Pseudomonadota bacterium]